MCNGTKYVARHHDDMRCGRLAIFGNTPSALGLVCSGRACPCSRRSTWLALSKHDVPARCAPFSGVFDVRWHLSRGRQCRAIVPPPKFWAIRKLWKHFLLVGKICSKMRNLCQVLPPFWANLKFRAPVIFSVGYVQLFVGKLQLPAPLRRRCPRTLWVVSPYKTDGRTDGQDT